jgi:DinB superfamily
VGSVTVMAATTRQDLIDLSEHVWARFLARMAGLTAPELAWQPVADPQLCLLWRLEHLASMLSEPRNATWLGQRTPATFPLGPPDPALNACRAAYEIWRGHLHAVTDEGLGIPIGDAAGRYAEGTRRSFVLHVLDELIHHTAEAALLRDLYPGAPSYQG